MANKSLLIIVGALSLVSCHSFNHIEISTGQAMVGTRAGLRPVDRVLSGAAISDDLLKSSNLGEPASTRPTQPTPNNNTHVSAVCPVYELPDMEPVPELPYDQLRALQNSNDPEAYDRIARKQISDLRMYISNMKRQLRDSHRTYLKECQEYLLSTYQNSLPK